MVGPLPSRVPARLIPIAKGPQLRVAEGPSDLVRATDRYHDVMPAAGIACRTHGTDPPYSGTHTLGNAMASLHPIDAGIGGGGGGWRGGWRGNRRRVQNHSVGRREVFASTALGGSSHTMPLRRLPHRRSTGRAITGQKPGVSVNRRDASNHQSLLVTVGGCLPIMVGDRERDVNSLHFFYREFFFLTGGHALHKEPARGGVRWGSPPVYNCHIDNNTYCHIDNNARHTKKIPTGRGPWGLLSR